MKIRVYGILRQYIDNRESVERDISEPIKINELLRDVGVPEKYVFVVEKNGKAIPKDSLVGNEDEISLIPFISGG